jgi:hypothetical protein
LQAPFRTCMFPCMEEFFLREEHPELGGSGWYEIQRLLDTAARLTILYHHTSVCYVVGQSPVNPMEDGYHKYRQKVSSVCDVVASMYSFTEVKGSCFTPAYGILRTGCCIRPGPN